MDESVGTAIDLLRSRFDAVDALRSEPYRKTKLDVSRSTVDRAVRDLETAGLVARTDEGYAATAYGDLLAARYESFLEAAGEIGDAAALLESLPADAPMSLALLRGATVHRAESPLPYQPIDRYEALLRTADRIRGLSRTISQSTTPDVVRERVVADGMESELVLGPDLAAYLRAEGRERQRAMLETGRHRLYEHPDVPYGLELLEADGRTRVVVFVYDESDELLGTVVNDAPAAVDWAEALFERYRADAADIADSFFENAES